ncbi:hypothetical protein J4409_02300 [Candidatus Woesearchaeota archaeon]|nr:hypothetical protein [Candidatus Woesearchaeota archaeon]
MAKKRDVNNKEYYTCEECGFLYKTKNLAEKCHEWCKKHKSCNINIVKHAVKL